MSKSWGGRIGFLFLASRVLQPSTPWKEDVFSPNTVCYYSNTLYIRQLWKAFRSPTVFIWYHIKPINVPLLRKIRWSEKFYITKWSSFVRTFICISFKFFSQWSTIDNVQMTISLKRFVFLPVKGVLYIATSIQKYHHRSDRIAQSIWRMEQRRIYFYVRRWEAYLWISFMPRLNKKLQRENLSKGNLMCEKITYRRTIYCK